MLNNIIYIYRLNTEKSDKQNNMWLVFKKIIITWKTVNNNMTLIDFRFYFEKITWYNKLLKLFMLSISDKLFFIIGKDYFKRGYISYHRDENVIFEIG